MAYASSASNVYKKNQVETASPKKLVILLYEAAIKNIRLAEIALEQENREKMNRHLIKAQDIITELSISLNHEGDSNEVASGLYSLYEYILSNLVEANTQKNAEKMMISRKLLSELLEAWTSI